MSNMLAARAPHPGPLQDGVRQPTGRMSAPPQGPAAASNPALQGVPHLMSNAKERGRARTMEQGHGEAGNEDVAHLQRCAGHHVSDGLKKVIVADYPLTVDDNPLAVDADAASIDDHTLKNSENKDLNGNVARQDVDDAKLFHGTENMTKENVTNSVRHVTNGPEEDVVDNVEAVNATQQVNCQKRNSFNDVNKLYNSADDNETTLAHLGQNVNQTENDKDNLTVNANHNLKSVGNGALNQSEANSAVLKFSEARMDLDKSVVHHTHADPDFNADPNFNVDPKLNPHLELKPDPNFNVDSNFNADPSLKADPDLNVAPKLNADPNFNADPDLNADPNFKAEPDLNAGPDVHLRPTLLKTGETKEARLVSPVRAKKLFQYLRERVEPAAKTKRRSEVAGPVAFQPYESMLLFLTQAGYLSVAASMLSTTFFEPSEAFCARFHAQLSRREVAALLAATRDFRSLPLEWGAACAPRQPWTVRASAAVMGGAVAGALVAGFLADRLGRKPVAVASQAALAAANLLLAALGPRSPRAAAALLLAAGCASGGYMVVNVVFVVEAVRTERERLVVASLNGWPIGMVFAALVSFACRDSVRYHLVTAAAAAAVAALLQLGAFESVGWLANRRRSRHAAHVRRRIADRNGAWTCRRLRARTPPEASPLHSPARRSAEPAGTPTLSYLDLLKHASIRRPLFALLYCFLSSSLVSFGFYFNAHALPGDRYLNLGLMGLLKFGLGLIPLLCSYLINKKTIILASVGLAASCSWALVASATLCGGWRSPWVTVLGLLVAGAMDPTWKVSHLYSVELFPTGVRNMARGACNVAARLGSMSGPLIILLRSYNPSLPYWLFACLLTVQWLVLALFMSSHGNDHLPEHMPTKIPKNNSEQTIVGKV